MTPGIDEVIVVPPNGGEVIGDAPDRRVEILSDAESVHVTWSRFAPGRDGADLHVHRRHTDLFYVLEGELTLKLGLQDERITAPAGTLIRVPPMVVHGFLNASADTQVRYLNFHAPGAQFADYLRALRDGRDFTYDQEPPPADGIRPPSEAAIGSASARGERDGLRIAVLSDVDAIAIAEVHSEAGATLAAGAGRRQHVEAFYVLDGSLTLTVGGREERASAATWLQIPAGMGREWALASDGPARLLHIQAPGCGSGGFLGGRV